jgi:hypothetical protein
MQRWSQILIQGELKRGYTIVTDDYAGDDWLPGTIISRDGDRVRFVILDARHPHTGAFTRLLARVQQDGLTPVIVEPFGEMEDWCVRHRWRCRVLGKGDDRHWVWYKRVE